MADTNLRFVLKAKDEASRAVSKVKHEIGGASGGLSKFKAAGAVAAVGIGLAVTAAVALYGALKKCLNAFTDYAGGIAKVQKLTGMSVKSTSQYMGVTKLMGIETTQATKAATMFAKTMYAAKKGTGAQADAFKALGVTLKDTHGKTKEMGAVMMEARDALSKMPAGAERTALSMKLFGKGGTEMMKWLSKSPEDMKKLTATVTKLGGVMGEDAIDKMGEYKQQQREIGFAWQMIQVNIGMRVIPAFILVGKYMLIGVTYLNQYVLKSKAFAVAMDIIVKVIQSMVPIITAVFKVIAGLFKLWTAIMTGNWRAAWNAIKGIAKSALDGIRGLVGIWGRLVGSALSAVWTGIKNKARSAWVRGR